jgi:hypothetical protein
VRWETLGRCAPADLVDARLQLHHETGADGVATKTIGLGLSPGDTSYAEPYWYASPWPYPEASTTLPPLPDGAHWHREGFTSAILTAGAWLAGGPDPEQPARLRSFLGTALAAGRRVHGV